MSLNMYQGSCKIKVTRLAKSITQEELATKCNVDQSYISKLESEEFFPASPQLIVKIAEVMKCQLSEVYAELDKIHALYFETNGKGEVTVRSNARKYFKTKGE